MKNYYGIDPGKDGAIVRLNPFKVIPIPLVGKQIDRLKLCHIYGEIADDPNAFVVTEHLLPLFLASKQTTWELARNVEAMSILLIAYGIPHVAIPPKEWQKVMWKGVPIMKKAGKTSNDTKAMSMVACNRLFPGYDLRISDDKDKPHDGVVDALLLAEYGRIQNY